MNATQKQVAHKLGANRKEIARSRPEKDPNFAQSRDIREDRGERQMKAARARQTLPHLVRGRLDVGRSRQSRVGRFREREAGR